MPSQQQDAGDGVARQDSSAVGGEAAQLEACGILGSGPRRIHAADGKTIASADANKKILIWTSSAKPLTPPAAPECDRTGVRAARPPFSVNGEEARDSGTLHRQDRASFQEHEMASVAWCRTARVAGSQHNDVLIWQEESASSSTRSKEAGSPPVGRHGRPGASGRVRTGQPHHAAHRSRRSFSLPTMAPVPRVGWTTTA